MFFTKKKTFDPKHLIELIDKALKDLDDEIEKYSFLTVENKYVNKTKNILHQLRMEVEENGLKINERVQRGVHDLGMYSFKIFENSNLENSLLAVHGMIHEDVAGYKTLEPLGLEYGKGNPF